MKLPENVIRKLKKNAEQIDNEFHLVWMLLTPSQERDEIMWHLLTAKKQINEIVEKGEITK